MDGNYWIPIWKGEIFGPGKEIEGLRGRTLVRRTSQHED